MMRNGLTNLILSRYKDEQLIIDGRIIITIVEVRGDKVKLGIESPPEVPVHRMEVYEAMKDEHGHAESLAREAHPSTKAVKPPPIQIPKFPRGYTVHEGRRPQRKATV